MESDVISRAKAIVDRRGLSLTRLYGLTGVAPNTWRLCFATGALPKTSDTCAAIRRFVELNEASGELRCV